jgi:diguanylate cyclase (GGDEF)-like protein
LSYSLIAICAAAFVITTLIKLKKITNKKVKNKTIIIYFCLYVIIQLGFTSCGTLLSGGINLSYILTILILSIIPVISPRKVISAVLGCTIYYFALMFAVRNISESWNTMVAGSEWYNIIMFASIIIAASFTIYDMCASNYLNMMKIDELANTDQLTGVANRHQFNRVFTKTWERAYTEKRGLAIMMLDVDFFKAYNDMFGHNAGDECLKKIAECLMKNFRRNDDIVSRFGGEEFLIVFNVDEENAFSVADKVRKSVENLKIPHAKTEVSPYVTISVGVCFVKPPSSADNGVVKKADEALYESKHNGRNKTTLVKFDLS